MIDKDNVIVEIISVHISLLITAYSVF